MRKFTLIELLVVIVIIVILSSFLLNALTKAKNTAKGILCANNLKQIVLSANLYTNDNNGWCVYGAIGGSPWPRFFLKEGKYFTNTEIFHCPSEEVFNIDAAGTYQDINYGLNYRTFGYGLDPSKTTLPVLEVQVSKFGNNTNLIYFGDGTPYSYHQRNIGIGWLLDFYQAVMPDDLYRNPTYPSANLRHNRFSNAAFFDSHVGKLNKTQIKTSNLHFSPQQQVNGTLSW